MTAPERIWTASTNGKCHVGFDAPSLNYTNEYVRADLAAIQPDPNAGAVKVKPLVWEPVGNPNGRYRLHSTIAWARNTCPYGPYFIGLSSSCKNGEYSWDGPANTGKRGFADPESAKAAAQADYAARILDALEPQPDPRDEVIAEAEARGMQRAAEICKSAWIQTPEPLTARDCYDAILAAIPQKDAPQ